MQIRETAFRPERNRELLALVNEGDEESSAHAIELLVEENSGLVRTVARRFVGRGTEEEDLIQIGMIGMVKAIRSFDLARETTFSTYAAPLIVGEIRRHLRDDGLIKVSRYHKRLGLELMNARNRIAAQNGYEPGIEELADICGVSAEKVMRELVAECNRKIYGLQASLLPVKNEFFGETVTCTGLLTGRDIVKAVLAYTQENGAFDELVLAGNTMKEFEDIFLCGMTLNEMKKKLDMKNIRVNRRCGRGFVEILATRKDKRRK
jgi:DNA-directed RNA polymerase sigma subunit (sigma70/sigma32)